MSTPMFSIVIPVYNIEEYIHECVKSVLSQDFSDYECILIDDGSTDNCPEICDEYAATDERFRVIHQENRGPSVARNAGIIVAEGDYIVLLDGDDIFVSRSALQNLSNIISGTKAEIIFNTKLTKFSTPEDRENVDMIISPIKTYRPMQLIKESKKNKAVLLGGAFYTVKRIFIIENNIFYKENILHEDIHWAPRLFCNCEFIAINNNPFYGYRINRHGSTTNTKTNKRLNSYLVILNDLFLLSENESSIYKKNIYASFYKNVWWKIFVAVATSMFGDIDFETRKRMIHELKKYSHCLLHTTTPKYFSIFLCIKIFSIENAMSLYLFLQRLRSKP